MKHILITTIAALLVVGCGPSAPDISIHETIFDGNIEVVKQHLAAGTDVDAKDEKGWTPLHEAALGGHKEIAELLIAKGADVNAKNNDGVTPLNWALGEIADLLRKHGGKTKKELEGGEPVAEAAKPERQARKVPDTIHEAAKKGNIEAVKQHLADDADVNGKDEDGYAPLHFAALAGHNEIVELLIAKGADVNAKNNYGSTPLEFASGETVNLLRKHGGKTGAELRAEGK